MDAQVAQLIADAAGRLAAVEIETARLDAELLLAHAVGCQRLDLHTRDAIDPEAQERFDALVERREGREPCAYLVGRQEFYSLDLTVTPAVLIPRPETETLVEVVLEHLPRLPPGPGLDLGTGSGAIAIAVATRSPSSWIAATDCSLRALEVARRNVAAHGLSDRIALAAGRMFDALPGRFAWIACNPPYIGTSERDILLEDVAWYEPESALFAGEDGLAVLRPLFSEACHHLLPGGLLAVECDPRQVSLLRGWGERFGRVSVTCDLAGRERVVSIRT